MTPLDLLLSTFLQETTESLDELGRNLESLRDLPAGEVARALTDAMRIAHNLKGAAMSVGAKDFAEGCHRLEDALEATRNGDQRPAPGDIDAWLAGVVALSDLARRPDLRREIELASKRLLGALDETSQSPAAPETGVIQPVAEGAGDVTSGPDDGEAPVENRQANRDTSVRVDARRLSDVMVTADEIRIAHARGHARLARVRQLLGELEQLAAGIDDVPRRLSDLSAVWTAFLQDETREVHQLGKLAGTLSHAVRRLTMLPLTTQLATWRGAMREAASALGKRARLETEVGLIELDKDVLDRLREPLGHLLRNAVDHGLETPEERVSKGKPAVGRVLVTAEAEGAFVRLSITDDGRGLDLERIGAAAIARGLSTAEAIAAMARDEVASLMFLPGFTTAEAVSRISGRGVGLHAVRTALDALGGTVTVRSAPDGEGTVFELVVPVSQISISGLLVRAGHTVYALPVNDVVRAVSTAAKDLVASAGETVLVSGGAAPVRAKSLEVALGLPAPPGSARGIAVIVERGVSRMALVVDEIVGELEYVARPLPWNVGALPGVGGAVLLGDGSLALSVDVGALLAPDWDDAVPVATPVETSRRHRVLVVDDSLVTRTLARGTLAGAGFEVVVSVDGEDAWTKLRRERFDAVVSDVQMPRLDGFGLTERIRRDARLRGLPVVLVTSLAEPRHAERGVAVGADAYIVKGEFEQKRLLEAIRRLLGSKSCPVS